MIPKTMNLPLKLVILRFPLSSQTLKFLGMFKGFDTVVILLSDS